MVQLLKSDQLHGTGYLANGEQSDKAEIDT